MDAYDALGLLSPDPHLDTIKDNMRNGVPDVRTVLAYFARTYQPKRYLEIGVRRGISMAMVASQAPACYLVGVDMWIENYGDNDNPGPDFVRAEIRKVNPQAEVTLLTGDSKVIVPLIKEPFDLILIDGDHSYNGALADLTNCEPLAADRIIVDDLNDPEVKKAWNEWKAVHRDVFGFEEIGQVGIATKRKQTKVS